MESGPRTNQLDFGGNPVCDLDPGFLSLGPDHIHVFMQQLWLMESVMYARGQHHFLVVSQH